MNFKPIVRIESPKPVLIDKNSSEYDSNNVKEYGFFYRVNKNEIYCPAKLVLYQNELNEHIEWILWVRASFDSFVRMTELANSDNNKTHLIGKLISPIFSYKDTSNLEIMMEFKLKERVNLPIIEILNNHKHLYLDYSQGMSENKYLEIQNTLSTRWHNR